MQTSMNLDDGVGPDPGEGRQCDECGRPYAPHYEGDDSLCGGCHGA